jgi:hypothetical protein
LIQKGKNTQRGNEIATRSPIILTDKAQNTPKKEIKQNGIKHILNQDILNKNEKQRENYHSRLSQKSNSRPKPMNIPQSQATFPPFELLKHRQIN